MNELDIPTTVHCSNVYKLAFDPTFSFILRETATLNTCKQNLPQRFGVKCPLNPLLGLKRYPTLVKFGDACPVSPPQGFCLCVYPVRSVGTRLSFSEADCSTNTGSGDRSLTVIITSFHKNAHLRQPLN